MTKETDIVARFLSVGSRSFSIELTTVATASATKIGSSVGRGSSAIVLTIAAAAVTITAMYRRARTGRLFISALDH